MEENLCMRGIRAGLHQPGVLGQRVVPRYVEAAAHKSELSRGALGTGVSANSLWPPRRGGPSVLLGRYFGPNTSIAIRPAFTAQGQPA